MTLGTLGVRGCARAVDVSGRCGIELPLWKIFRAVSGTGCGTRGDIDAREGRCLGR